MDMQNLYCSTQRVCVYLSVWEIRPLRGPLCASESVYQFCTSLLFGRDMSIAPLASSWWTAIFYLLTMPPMGTVRMYVLAPRTRVLLVFYGFIIARFSEWCPLYLHACIELYIIYHTNQCLTVSSSLTSFSPRRQSQSAWCLLFLGRNRWFLLETTASWVLSSCARRQQSKRGGTSSWALSSFVRRQQSKGGGGWGRTPVMPAGTCHHVQEGSVYKYI